MPDNVSYFGELFTASNMELIIFQAEDMQFVMPKYVLNCPGTFFEGMFAAPAPLDDNGKKIGNEKNVIFLEKIAEDLGCEKILAIDFEAFLHVLYPLDEQVPTRHKCREYEYWCAVLKLATMWEFEEVKNKAIEGLTPLLEDKEAAETIWLGRKYHLPQWIRRGYTRICKDESHSPVDLGEPPQQPLSCRPLDWRTIAYLCHIQSEINKLGNRNSKVPDNVACISCKNTGCTHVKSGIYCSSCGSTQAPERVALSHIDTLISLHFKEELDILVSGQ